MDRKIETCRKWFIFFAGTILLITGLAKVVSAFGTAEVLSLRDPIFGLPFRMLIGPVGAIELAVSLICFLSAKRKLALALVAWLACSFLIYRAGLWYMSWPIPCSCLGTLTDTLHISPTLADSILKLALGVLLVGSFLFAAPKQTIQKGFDKLLCRRVTGRLVVIMVVLAEVLHAEPQQFSVSGVIESKYFKADESLARVDINSFEVVVNNCVWSIKLHPSSATNNAFSAKCDGTNIYLIHDLSNSIEAQRKAGAKVGANVATALVVKGQVPHDPFAEGIGAIWLTYASSCYFKDKSDNTIEPMFRIADSLLLQDQVVYQKATWRLNDTLSVPQEMAIQNDGLMLTYRSLSQSYKPQRYSPPYDNGFTVAKFACIAFTNALGFRFPAVSTFDVFGTKSKASSSKDLRSVAAHRITSSHVSDRADIDAAPPIVPGETVVTDSRFLGEKVMAFGYHVVERIPADSEVRELPQYQRAKKIGLVIPKSFGAAQDFTPPKGSRTVVLLLLILLAFIPLFLFGRWRREKTNKKRQ